MHHWRQLIYLRGLDQCACTARIDGSGARSM